MLSLNTAGQQSLASAIAMIVVTIPAVGLRCYTRKLKKVKLGADDWWIVAAEILFIGMIGVELWGLYAGGGGRNIADLQALSKEAPYLQNYLKSLVGILPLYECCITCVKISILCLYRRIFAVNKVFRKISLGMIVLCVAWWISIIVSSIVSCLPPEKLWKPELEGFCFNFGLFFVWIESFDIGIDFLILILPIAMIQTLQLSPRNKLILSSIFLLGGFVIVTGIIRVIYTYVPGSPYINFTASELWTNLNTGVAIVCACLPVYRPLLPGIANLAGSLMNRSGLRSLLRTSNKSSNNYSSHNHTYNGELKTIDSTTDRSGAGYAYGQKEAGYHVHTSSRGTEERCTCGRESLENEHAHELPQMHATLNAPWGRDESDAVPLRDIRMNKSFAVSST